MSFVLTHKFCENQKKFQQHILRVKKPIFKFSGEENYICRVFFFFYSSSGMKHASAKTRLYITTYAKFISFVEFMTEKEKNNGEKDFELKVSRKVSSEISSFVKIKQLKDTIQGKTF